MSAKLKLFAAFAGVARALGNANRLDLIEHLAQGEKSVKSLTAKTGLSVANTSQHLQALHRAGLVKARRRGKHVLYSLSADDILDLLAALRTVGERHAATVHCVIEDYFRARDRLEAVAFDELAEKLAAGLVTVLDVRPPDEFADGHLPRAVSMPLAEIESRLSELPDGMEIVAYCRGPWCVLAFEAVALLRSKGHAARRLDGGLPEWRRAGFDVAIGGAQ